MSLIRQMGEKDNLDSKKIKWENDIKIYDKVDQEYNSKVWELNGESLKSYIILSEIRNVLTIKIIV